MCGPATETGGMRPAVHDALFATLLLTGCATRTAGAETETALRARLQAEHDATLRLELQGRLDEAAIARGVREVLAWWDGASAVVTGSVDARGTVSIAVPTIEAHDRYATTVLHFVDGTGTHWYCWLDLTQAPPAGRHDLGELQLRG